MSASWSLMGSGTKVGVLSASLGNRSPDLQIAAKSLEHGLTNRHTELAHFTPAGVAVFDPFTGNAYPPS